MVNSTLNIVNLRSLKSPFNSGWGVLFKSFIAVLVALLSMQSGAFAAQRTCGTPNASYAKANAMRAVQQNWMNGSQRLSPTDVVIPVHFHILRYDNGSGDVADTVIFDQLDVLSASFSDTRYLFALDGITRTNKTVWTEGIQGTSDETDMKDDLAVDVSSVLNVYLCKKPRGFIGPQLVEILGYATFPNDHS